MKAIQIYNFYISSAERNSGSLSDVNLYLSQPITKTAKNSYFSIRANSITIPFSFHQLSPDIATIPILFTDSLGNFKSSSITLTSGNYNCINVLDELKGKLIAECQISSLPFIGYTPSLTFSYSQTTNKSTYVMAGSGSQSITIQFSQNTNLGKFFGFETDVLIDPLISATSTKTCVANPVNTIYLRSGNLKQRLNQEWIVQNGVYSDIIYVVPIYTQQNTYIQSEHTGDENILTDDIIKEINLYISTNLSYNPINLNGLEFSCSITISEMILDKYEPIQDTLLQSLPLPQPQPQQTQLNEGDSSDLVALQKQRDEIVQKLLKYKDKVEKKIKSKNIKDTNKEDKDV